MRRLSALIVGLILIGSGIAVGERPPGPKLEEVVALHERATGWSKATALRSLRISGSYEFSGATRSFVMVRQRPDRFRLELDVDGQVLVWSYDGQVAWEQNPFDGENPGPRVMEEDAGVRFVEEWADFDGNLIGWKKAGLEAELVGPAEVDGQPAWHVELAFPSGHRHQLYLDQESGLLLKQVTTNRHPRRGEVPRNWYFMEYGEAAGVVLPHYFEREDSQMVRGYVFEKVEANPEIARDLFSLPKVDEPPAD